jgi:hypothetical protein
MSSMTDIENIKTNQDTIIEKHFWSILNFMPLSPLFNCLLTKRRRASEQRACKNRGVERAWRPRIRGSDPTCELRGPTSEVEPLSRR